MGFPSAASHYSGKGVYIERLLGKITYLLDTKLVCDMLSFDILEVSDSDGPLAPPKSGAMGHGC